MVVGVVGVGMGVVGGNEGVDEEDEDGKHSWQIVGMGCGDGVGEGEGDCDSSCDDDVDVDVDVDVFRLWCVCGIVALGVLSVDDSREENDETPCFGPRACPRPCSHCPSP